MKVWETTFDLADRVLLQEKLAQIAALRLSVDGSGKRHVLKCGFWDSAHSKPAKVLLSAFVFVRETADAFVEEIKLVLDEVGFTLPKVQFFMLDLSSTNLAHVVGIVAKLPGTGAAPCDLHILNRAFQVAFEYTFGSSEQGDIHVLQLGYQVAHLLSSDWATYQPLLQREVDKHCASSSIPSFHVNHVQLPVLTRWWTVLLNFMWVLNLRKPLMQLAQYVHDYFPSSQSGLLARWQKLHVLLKVRVLRAGMTLIAEFGKVHLEMVSS